jgi:hypothetical protein
MRETDGARFIAIEGNGQLTIDIGQNYQDEGLSDLPEAHEIVRLLEQQNAPHAGGQ